MKFSAYALLGFALFLTACNGAQIEELERQNASLRDQYKTLETEAAQAKAAQQRLADLGRYMEGLNARINTTAGTITVRFFPDSAPIHVFAFVSRAEAGYYNGTYFHRVMPGFMIQGGDPNTKNSNPEDDGLGGPMGAIPHEFNPREHKRGILSMARVPDKAQGAGSQFFIMHADYPSLNNEYTVFGEVLSGLEVVDAIATAPINNSDPRFPNRPANPVKITSVEVFKP